MNNFLLCMVALLMGTGIWLYIIRKADMLEPESLRTILRIMIIGGLCSTFMAGVLNSFFMLLFDADLEQGMGLVSGAVLALFVGFNEESWKALLFREQVVRLKEMNEPLDAMVYSTSVALGFAFFENISYMIEGGMSVLLIRMVVSVPLHVGVAAFYGYGMAQEQFGCALKMSFSKGVVIASLVHALFDWLLFTQTTSQPVLALGLSVATAWACVFFMNSRMKALAAISPFLDVQCPACERVMPLGSVLCAVCGERLTNGDRFGFE